MIVEVVAQNVADGSFRYMPRQDWYGEDRFTYTLSDGVVDSNLATVTLTVAPVNDAPVLTNQFLATAEDTTLTGNLLATAADMEGDALSVALVEGPAHGTLALDADGSFIYTPIANFHGIDAFNYRVNDGRLDSNLATASLTVTPVNDAPVIAPRTVQLDEDTQIVVDLRKDASDVDGDTLTITITGQPQHGTLTQDAGGTWTYAPNANWNGTDVIDYLVGDGQSSTATQLTFVVSAINDAPTLADQALVTAEDTSLAGNLLATAADVEGDSLTVTLVAGPAHGTLALDAYCGFVYTPNINFNGSDAFTYRVNDGELDSDLATVALTVMPVNDAPVIAPRTVTLDEDAQFVIDLLEGATDVDGDTLAVLITAQPQHGTLMPNTEGTFTYVPDADWNGSDVVEYVVTDGQASTATQLTFLVNAINDAPTLGDQTLVTDEDIAFAGNLLATAADIEGDALSATLVAGPAHGALALDGDGGFTYTPDADFNGSDAFTYRVNDGERDSRLATVMIAVSSINDAPVIAPRALALDEDSQLVIDLLEGASDVDGDMLAVAITTMPQHGTLTQNADGRWTYGPAANWNGTDVVEYAVSDGTAATPSHVTFVVNAVNDAPVASDLAATLLEDGHITLNLLEAAFDVDGDALTATPDAPAHGQLLRNDDGTWTYVPDANFNGEDRFTYAVTDGVLVSNLAVIRLTITAVNDAPTAADDTAELAEDGRVTLALLANDNDIDGNALSIIIDTPPAHGTLAANADHTVTYVPTKDWSGEDVFTYHVNDGELNSAPATVRLMVAAVADAPTLVLSERPGATSEVFRSSWETATADDKREGEGRPPLVKRNTLEGWTLLGRTDDDHDDQRCDDGRGEGPEGFELWTNGDRMEDAAHKRHVVYAATDNGTRWLELSDAKGEGHQTMGIERTIDTVAGATYTLSLDLAGHLGYSAEYTRIGIYVEGVRIGGAGNTSPATALDWQTRQFQFAGMGGKQTIRIVAEPTKRESNGRGMMLDDVALSETLPANTGREDGAVPLSAVGAALTDTDGSETLTLHIAALPVGATLSDGTNSFTAVAGGTIADVTGWALGRLVLRPPQDFNGVLTLQVVATATEKGNGDAASSAVDLVVSVLAVNDAPTAQDASFTLQEDGSIRIDFARLIDDVDGDVLTLSLGKPERGTLTRNTDGSYTYTPKKGYSGTDRFTYTVSDGRFAATATVTLTVLPKTDDDERDCHDDRGRHEGVDHSDHHGYRASDAGASARITVQSRVAGDRASERSNDGNAPCIVLGQGSDLAPKTILKIDWNGVAPDLGRLKGNEWEKEYFFGKKKDERSLAEITGLKVRLER